MMTNYKIQPNDQLYVNNKWYFDVLSIEGDSAKVRIKYHEGIQQKYSSYRTIKLPLSIFQDCIVDNFIVLCKVHEPSLKLQIGGLINRLTIEPNVVQFAERKTNEDVSSAGSGAGMGAVVNPGLSGTPGVHGSFGSGDIAQTIKYGSTKTGVTPKREFGLQITSKSTMKHHRKASKKQTGTLIKTPVINLSENADPVVDIEVTNTDNDYKTSVYSFLDYPTDNEFDLKFIGVISEHRPEILNISCERLVQYFRDLYNTNRALIKNKCSEWFQNNIMILGQING